MPRPRFDPTSEQRRMVRAIAGFGIAEKEIAASIGERGIDPKTLRKHFRRELDTGATKANLAVAQSLFKMATSGSHPGAAMFWLARRGGAAWKETTAVEHSGPQGGPIEIADTRKRITDELARLASSRNAPPETPSSRPPIEAAQDKSTRKER
jgi:hypothetical protein